MNVKGHNKSAAPLPKLIAPLVGLVNRFGDLGMDDSPLRGAGVGAALGTPVGALYGALFPREEYVQKKDKKGKPIVDKDGDPIYEMRTKSRLGEAVRRGVTGAGIGGAFGAVPALKRTLLGALRADNSGSTPGPGSRGEISTKNNKRQVATDDLIKSLNSFKFPQETAAKASLREVVNPYYRDAEGGFDTAVREALKYRPEAKELGLTTFDEADLDAPIRVSSKGPDFFRTMSNLRGRSSYEGNREKVETAGITARKDIPGIKSYGEVYLNPMANARGSYDTLAHEFTHAAFGPPRSLSLPSLINEKQREELKNLLKNRTSASSKDIDDYAKYIGNPAEWGAHLGQAKRQFIKDFGRQVTTPDDAKKVLDYYMSDRYPEKADVLKQLMPFLIKNDDLKKKAIMQILSIVQGKPSRQDIGMA
jgi:hypothetical protein